MELFKSMDQSDEKKDQNNLFNQQPKETVKTLIIGSGPAGFTAAIYTARANISPVLYQGLQPGGQLTTTTEVENFPGYPEGVTGPVLMQDLQKQAERFDTDVRWGIATAVDFSQRPFKVIIDDKDLILAESVIIATGATAKYLGLESEEKYKGSGVSGCATCDGFFYKGLDVAVVGGGDTACEEALYLSGICNKVYIIVRKNYLRASKVMQKRVMDSEKIEVLFERNTKEIVGKQVVEGAILLKPDGSEEKIDIAGFFLGIGHKPNTDIFKPYINTDDAGYIITENGSTKTNIPGVCACGDVQDSHYRQAVTAAGSGCMAAIDTERFLMAQ